MRNDKITRTIQFLLHVFESLKNRRSELKIEGIWKVSLQTKEDVKDLVKNIIVLLLGVGVTIAVFGGVSLFIPIETVETVATMTGIILFVLILTLPPEVTVRFLKGDQMWRFMLVSGFILGGLAFAEVQHILYPIFSFLNISLNDILSASINLFDYENGFSIHHH